MQVITANNTTQRLDFFTELLVSSVDLSKPFYCLCFERDGDKDDVTYIQATSATVSNNYRLQLEFDTTPLGDVTKKKDFNLYLVSQDIYVEERGKYQELIRLRNG